MYPSGGYQHWEVLFPIITRRGFKLIMISTPRGKNTKFYEVCANPDGFYSVHFCDIYQSVFEEGYQLYDAKGQPFPQATRAEQDLAIATFRKIYNSESKWPREYECQFTGDLSSLISWAQIERAADLGRGCPFDYLHVEAKGSPLGPVWLAMKSEAAAGYSVEIGWDVARTGHLSAVTINFAKPNQPKRLRFLVTMHNLEFEEQRAFVNASMGLRWSGVGHGDATGLGMESNEVLEKRYPERWTPYQFTVQGKRAIASALSTAFSDGMQTLPNLSGPYKFVATDVYAVQKDDTGAALLLEETPNVLLPGSHCDIAYSLGLARLAGARNALPPVPKPRRTIPVGCGL
jgi:phage FluMu gp28-like protein